MARPKSEDKRMALLAAATEVVAARGLSAPTFLIAKKARVAEGTLFRYFSTKEDLFNELYIHLKRSICEGVEAHGLGSGSLKIQVQTLWNGYIDWALAYPEANKAIIQLSVSEVIKPETKAKATKLFPQIKGFSALCSSANDRDARKDAFMDAIFLALADVTIAFATRERKEASIYKARGFEVLWRAFGMDANPGL